MHTGTDWIYDTEQENIKSAAKDALFTCNWLKRPVFVFRFQMDIDEGMSEVLYKKLLELEKEVRRKLTDWNADKEDRGE